LIAVLVLFGLSALFYSSISGRLLAGYLLIYLRFSLIIFPPLDARTIL
jgi:hypothetical protein